MTGSGGINFNCLGLELRLLAAQVRLAFANGRQTR